MRFPDSTASLLVVDDTPEALTVLEDLLSRAGHQVAAFCSGAEALAAVDAVQPALALIDVRMSGMDGFELARRLRAHPAFGDRPVLFVSALPDIDHKLAAFEAGGVDYVTKPFAEPEVIARVTTHLRLYQMQHLLRDRAAALEAEVRAQYMAVLEGRDALISALAHLAQIRDDTTGRHLDRVAACCHRLAHGLRGHPERGSQITPELLAHIGEASKLHDIGKVGVPDAILLKPGRLSPEEFDQIRRHPTLGAAALRRVLDRYPDNPGLWVAADIAEAHHERWDGAGYPKGLAGEAIPLAARIMAVADVYDALRSVRPYKPGWTHAAARDMVVEGSGSHFDPAVVQVFLGCEASIAADFEGVPSGED